MKIEILKTKLKMSLTQELLEMATKKKLGKEKREFFDMSVK
jgi:hypothetical protein